MIGPRNLSKARRASRVSPEKRLSSEAGRMAVSTGGMKAAEAARQNRVTVRTDRHHPRHRATVRGLMPRTSLRCVNRLAVAPCSIAVISTTAVAR